QQRANPASRVATIFDITVRASARHGTLPTNAFSTAHRRCDPRHRRVAQEPWMVSRKDLTRAVMTAIIALALFTSGYVAGLATPRVGWASSLSPDEPPAVASTFAV